MSKTTHHTTNAADTQPAYVELVFRLHDNGRRELFARQADRLPDGTLVDHEGRPSGPLAEQALQEAIERDLLPRRRATTRRVDISQGAGRDGRRELRSASGAPLRRGPGGAGRPRW